MTRAISGFYVLTAVLAICAGSLFVGSRAAGLLFEIAPTAIQDSVLIPIAGWLSGFSYGRLLVAWIMGITVPIPVIWYLMIMTVSALIVALGMAFTHVIERSLGQISN